MAEKDKAYYFHQTPKDLAKTLVEMCPIEENDIVIEPFKGEGAFYDAFPQNCRKEWAEITEGKDYKDITRAYDWVITNPPFRLQTHQTKRINSFWLLLDYYAQRARKGIGFLANDRCFSVFTPKRIEYLKEMGWEITKICCCSVKKWRGRYYFIILQRKPAGFFLCLKENY